MEIAPFVGANWLKVQLPRAETRPTFRGDETDFSLVIPMQHNPVGWFEIYVQDMARAKAFYSAVFGVGFESLESGDLDMWAFPMAGEVPGAPGALVRMEGMSSGGNSTIVYFSCEDCGVEAQRAAAGGGRIFKDKFSIGVHGFIALVTDPDGNMIGLHSMR